jgi:hypothetical protein
MTDTSKDATQLASGGAVLAGSVSVLRERDYAFGPQLATIFSEIPEYVSFLMTVTNLHQ